VSGRERQRGIALLIVIWVFMALGVIALDFSRYIRDDAMATMNFADETQSYYAAVAGMNFAIWQVRTGKICVPKPHDPDPDGEDDVPIGCINDASLPPDEDGDGLPDKTIILHSRYDVGKGWFQGEAIDGRLYRIQVTDERGKVPINDADDDLLKALVTSLVRGTNATEGIDRGEEREIDGVVAGILAWRDPSGVSEDSIGTDARSQHGLDFRRNSLMPGFLFPEDLLHAPGVTPELFYGRDGGPGLVDLVSTLRGGDVEDEEARKRPNPLTATPDVARLLENYLKDVNDLAFDLTLVRIRACADVRQVRNQARIEAVVELDPTGGSATIKLWNDRAPLWSDAPEGCRPTEEALA
jgi:hypothetical protein